MIKIKSITVSILTAIIVIIAAVPIKINAVETTAPSASASPSSASSVIDNLKKIQDLKEKIATKVAEIRQKEKAGLFGIIKKIENSSMTITTKNVDKTFSLTEDTIYYSLTGGEKKESSHKNLREGDAITILGYFDDSKTTLSSKYIFLEKPSAHYIGKIADVDKTNYTVTLKDPQGSTIVDIESYTKVVSFSKDKGLTKIGFSKLNIGDTIHLTATPNPKEANRVSALRIITLSFNQPQTPTPALSKEPASPSAVPKVKPTI